MNNIHIFQCAVLNQDKKNNHNIEMFTNGSLEETKLVLITCNDKMNKLEIIDSFDLVVNPMIVESFYDKYTHTHIFV